MERKDGNHTMRKKIEPFVDDEIMEPRQEEPKEPVSDEEVEVMMRWYGLLSYLEKNPDGSVKEPYKIIDGAPDWCPSILEQWVEARKEVFKVP